jgi:hypothetical protein
MSDTHDPPLRVGHRGHALRGLDWVIIFESISEDFALPIALLCFLEPATDHGDGPTCSRRRAEMARQTRRRTLVIPRPRQGEDTPAEGRLQARPFDSLAQVTSVGQRLPHFDSSPLPRDAEVDDAR